MDDELCDTVMLGVVHLQAAFSGRRALTHQGFGANDGAHLSKGCTRGTTGVRCVLQLLRVLRCTTIALPRQSEHNPLDALSATCTTCCDPYTTVLVQLCHAAHTWYVLGERPTLAKEGSRWIVGRSVGVAHSPTDVRDAWGLVGSRT